MDLSTYKFPDVTEIDLVFPTVNTTIELVEEAIMDKCCVLAINTRTQHLVYNVTVVMFATSPIRIFEFRGVIC